MPEGYDRFKIWMAIHTEPGRNGLKMLADSHKRQWMHHFELRDGINKPIFDEPEPEMPLLPLKPGEMVLFHDETLHGGVVNPGETCRVSIELTVLFDPRDARRRLAA
jgi:ectoine hydroxylase-related dioxygenase (phytanoyl-CoA dioxygenase family)